MGHAYSLDMQVTIEVGDQVIRDALRSGMAGIGYWCGSVTYATEPERWTVTDRDTGVEHTFQMCDVTTAVELMASRHPHCFGLLIAGRGDRYTGDMLVQLAAFRSVVYG
jgi:hypothetical protein